MDELKLLLNTKFIRGIVTKIIAKLIFKKTGYQVDISLNNLSAQVVDGKVHLHVDADAKMDANDLVAIIKSKDLI